MPDLSPARVMEVGMAFWPSKVLLSAIDLGVFTALEEPDDRRRASGRPSAPSARQSRFLRHARRLAFSRRDGDGPAAKYRNTPRPRRFSIARVRSSWAASWRWRMPASIGSGAT